MNNKNIKQIILIIIVLLAVFGIGYAIKKNQDNKNKALEYSPSEIQALEESERKRVLEIQLKDLESRSQSLPSDATDSDRFVVYIQLAEVRIALGKYDEAISALDTIRDQNLGNTRIWETYAKAYKEKGDIAKAKESIQKAFDIDNELASVWVTYLELNQDLPTDQLNGLYRQAIVNTKSNLDVMISYARFSEKIGNIDQAVAAWETAINVNPEKESEYRAEIVRLRPPQQ